jgi:hypothetical protein
VSNRILSHLIHQTLNKEQILSLVNFCFNPSNRAWNASGALPPSLVPLVQHLYTTPSAVTAPAPVASPGAAASTSEELRVYAEGIKSLKGELFNKIISSTNLLCFPETAHLLTTILVLCRTHRDTLVQLDWKQYLSIFCPLLSFITQVLTRSCYQSSSFAFFWWKGKSTLRENSGFFLFC